MAAPRPEVDAPLRLPSGDLLPILRVVEAEEVHLHEEVDPRRVAALADRLAGEQILRNPPVAAALPAGGYVILDGANRTSALRAMRAPYHALQIVDYARPNIRLEVWHHLLTEDGGRVMEAVPEEAVARLPDWGALEQQLGDGLVACGLVAEQGVVGVRTDPGLGARLAMLRRIVETYSGRVPIYRVLTADLETLRAKYDRVGVVVVFPRFSKEEILGLAALPAKLPTGITRHVIPNRALRVNIPLDLLASPGALEAKNAALGDLVHARLLAHRVRFYAEPTVLFDD